MKQQSEMSRDSFDPGWRKREAMYMPITLNDDDWYIFDTITKELITQRGPSLPAHAIAGITEPDQTALRGLAIKCRGIELWRQA